MSDTILFLPGLLCDARLWAAQTVALSDRYTCVVADMTLDDSIEGMARRALATLPERFAVAGLSMGGYAAMTLMRIAPERVERVAFLDTSPHADTAERVTAREGLVGRVEAGGFEDVIESHFQTFVHPSRLGDDRVMGDIRAAALGVGPEAYVRQQRAIMARPDNRAVLEAVRCPALVLCGAQDALTPPQLHDEMAALIPGADLVKVDECGHLSPLERPEAVTAALRAWLNRT